MKKIIFLLLISFNVNAVQPSSTSASVSSSSIVITSGNSTAYAGNVVGSVNNNVVRNFNITNGTGSNYLSSSSTIANGQVIGGSTSFNFPLR